VTTRIVLADDHRMFRDGLRSLLMAHADLEVVGEAEDGLGALQLARELQPDLLILDLSMPGLNGIEVTRRLALDSPATGVVILSMHGDRRYVREALRAGARGYVLKEAGFSELSHVIAEVLAGRLYLSPAVGEQIVQDYLRLADDEPGGVFAVLSAREREVLQMLAEGKPTKAIAAELYLSVKTVESHRKQVMDKLGIRSVAELTKYAIREGLTSLD